MRDLSIFNELNPKIKPIGLKFLLFKPEGLRKLDKKLALCEMFREAQISDPFYAELDSFNCVGPILMGMAESDPVFESGHIGQSLNIFEEARANRRLYHYITKLEKGSVNYLAFASLDKISFEPDLVLLAVEAPQLEVILRALCFATGKMWTSKGTPVIACSWLTTYPYISGEVNYVITDVSHGMVAKQIFPPGTILVSVPYDQLDNLIRSLQKIEWYPALLSEGRDAHDRLFEETAVQLHQRLESEKH
jgi:uncharacterized protein (DUF169 family)